MIFLFDVDGTLTEPRRPIKEDVAATLIDLAEKAPVYTVTGSPREWYNGQICGPLSRKLAGEFWCSGNHYRLGSTVTQRRFERVPGILEMLHSLWDGSSYTEKDGCFLQVRPGALYFAVCGVNATPEEREDYARWDTRFWERDTHAGILRQAFPQLEIVTGGVVSIDILNKGHDKSQVVDLIPYRDGSELVFFGDKIGIGGNDHSLARKVEDAGGRVVGVRGPADTMEALREWTATCT